MMFTFRSKHNLINVLHTSILVASRMCNVRHTSKKFTSSYNDVTDHSYDQDPLPPLPSFSKVLYSCL